MIIQKPKGTYDLLPEKAFSRVYAESKIREIFDLFNYREIRTPTFEYTSLFKRSIGENTDIVSKEMFTFNNSQYSLKPEMTAPVIRAYLENGLYNQSPLIKLYYISNMYRYERPQAGRFREFSQFGAEAIGSSEPFIDAEMIVLAAFILSEFQIRNYKIKLNNIGTPDERKKYLEKLFNYLNKFKNDLSEDSKKRLQKNPLRILDSKMPEDRKIIENAPRLYDYLEQSTIKNFEQVQSLLSGLGISYEIDYFLVRGLDYYTSTTFEIVSDELGAQDAIFGGGRYDLLTKQLGGKPTPAIGFACGFERFFSLMEKYEYCIPEENKCILYIVTSGNKASVFALNLIYELRKSGFKCEMDYLNRSIKSQMKEANKINAAYTAVIGNNELDSGKILMKKMSDGNQTEININNINNFLINENKTGKTG